jgi:hypothetical protein
MTAAAAAKANERPLFRLLLRPEPGVVEPERALRRALKILLRRRLKCLAVERVRQP